MSDGWHASLEGAPSEWSAAGGTKHVLGRKDCLPRRQQPQIERRSAQQVGGGEVGYQPIHKQNEFSLFWSGMQGERKASDILLPGQIHRRALGSGRLSGHSMETIKSSNEMQVC